MHTRIVRALILLDSVLLTAILLLEPGVSIEASVLLVIGCILSTLILAFSEALDPRSIAATYIAVLALLGLAAIHHQPTTALAVHVILTFPTLHAAKRIAAKRVEEEHRCYRICL